jgi:hypothetical protein
MDRWRPDGMKKWAVFLIGLFSIPTAVAQDIPIPSTVQRCLEVHEGVAASDIADSELERCYSAAVSFARSQGWLTRAGSWVFSGYEKNRLKQTTFIAVVPSSAGTCSEADVGSGAGYKGRIFRSFQEQLSPAAAQRLGQPSSPGVQTATQLVNLRCTLGAPNKAADALEMELKLIAEGPQSFGCQDFDPTPDACGPPELEANTFRNTEPERHPDMKELRARSYELLLQLIRG